MDDPGVQQLSMLFKAIADPKRQQILLLLRQNAELTVGEITSAIQATQPATSQHLLVLKTVGVLVSRKSGLQVYYRLCSIQLYDAIVEFMKVYQREAIQTTNEKR